MKTIVKILIVMAIAIFPFSVNAQDSHIEFAEKGIVSNEEAFKAFNEHQEQMLTLEKNKLELEYNIKVKELNKKEDILEVWQSIFAIFAVFGSIILIVFLSIQYHKAKNKRQNELIEKIIDKGEFHSTQTDNKLLELLLQQDKTIKYSKFITDITIFGIGLGLIFIPNDEYGTDILAFILLFVGIGRILVRSCILAFDTKKNKKDKNSPKNLTAENTAADIIETAEIDENKEEETVTTIETAPETNENHESNSHNK